MRLILKPKPLSVTGHVLLVPLQRNQDVHKTFKEGKSKINNMDGGVGKLQTAVDRIDDRLTKVEEPRQEKIKTAGEKLGVFLRNAIRTDKKVAGMIATTQGKFFEANPWAIPPAPPKKKSLWQRIKDAFKKAGKAVANVFKKAGKWIVSTAKKVWSKTVAFVKKHWKAIVKIAIGVVVIAGLAALSVFTGGAAAPLLLAAAKGAAICACTSAAVTVVSGAIKGQSFATIFDSAADSFMVGSITGAVTGVAGAAAGAVTSATGSQVLGEVTKIGVEMGGKMLANGASYVIDNGSLSGFMDAKGYDILKEGATGVAGAFGGYFVDKGKDLLGTTFKGLKDSQLANSFKSFYQTCEDAAPTLTKIVTDSAKSTISDLSVGDLINLKNPAEFAKGLGKSFLGNLADGAMGVAKDYVGGAINDLTGGVSEKLTGYVTDIVGDDFGKAFPGAYDELKGAYDTIYDTVYDKAYGEINTVVDSAKGQVSGAVNSIVGEFKDIASSVSDASGFIRNDYNLFQNKLDKAVSGIASGASYIGGEIKGLEGNFGTIIKAAASQIRTSPATVMKDMVRSGAAVGIVGTVERMHFCSPAATVVREVNRSFRRLSTVN